MASGAGSQPAVSTSPLRIVAEVQNQTWLWSPPLGRSVGDQEAPLRSALASHTLRGVATGAACGSSRIWQPGAPESKSGCPRAPPRVPLPTASSRSHVQSIGVPFWAVSPPEQTSCFFSPRLPAALLVNTCSGGPSGRSRPRGRRPPAVSPPTPFPHSELMVLSGGFATNQPRPELPGGVTPGRPQVPVAWPGQRVWFARAAS